MSVQLLNESAHFQMKVLLNVEPRTCLAPSQKLKKVTNKESLREVTPGMFHRVTAMHQGLQERYSRSWVDFGAAFL